MNLVGSHEIPETSQFLGNQMLDVQHGDAILSARPSWKMPESYSLSARDNPVEAATRMRLQLQQQLQRKPSRIQRKYLLIRNNLLASFSQKTLRFGDAR